MSHGIHPEDYQSPYWAEEHCISNHYLLAVCTYSADAANCAVVHIVRFPLQRGLHLRNHGRFKPRVGGSGKIIRASTIE